MSESSKYIGRWVDGFFEQEICDGNNLVAGFVYNAVITSIHIKSNANKIYYVIVEKNHITI